MDLSDILTITELLSGMASGRNQSQALNEQLGISSANAANNAQLGFDKFNLEAPGERLRQSRVADIGSRAQPVTAGSGIDPASGKKVVKWEGGVNTPDLYSKQTNQLADEIGHQHLMDQLAGPKKPTVMPQVGKSDTMSKVLSGATAGASGLSILKLLGLLPSKGGGGGVDSGSVFGGLGHWDDAGNWVSDTPTIGDPSKPLGWLFPVTPENPNHD